MKKMEHNGASPRLRAVFTVEAALVIPLILAVLAMLIQMTLYLTDTVRLEALMAENAQSENEGDPEAEGIFLLREVRWETEESGDVRTISGRAQTSRAVFGKKITWETSLSHEKRECAAALRRIARLIRAAKDGGD